MAVVYRHRRDDTNKIFYIGIGIKESRAYQIRSRNPLWKNITNKTNYTIEIIAKDITYDEAKELEILLISEYGRIDNNTGILCNMTDGGDGNNNFSESTILKISKSLTGKTQSCETRNKRSNSLIEVFKNPEIKNKQRLKALESHSKGIINRKGKPNKGYSEYNGKFRVRVVIDGIRKSFGNFNTEEEAKQMYNLIKNNIYEDKC